MSRARWKNGKDTTMSDATADAINRLQSIAAWLKEDPNNILFLDPDHVRILRDFLDGKYPKRLSGQVTVKALEWEPGVAIWARPLPGMKYVVVTDHQSESCAWWLEGVKDSRVVCATETEAKAAAQADFEARILAAIDTAPAPSPDQIRREAFREALGITYQEIDKLQMGPAVVALEKVAARIRTLKSETKP